MRLLMISARADFGGGPEHIRKIIECLRDKVDIYVACPNDLPYWSLYSLLVGEERMLEIPHRAFNLKSALDLVKACRLHKIDIIHSHGKGAGIYSRIIGKLTKTPVIHTPHGLHIERYGRIGRWVYLSIERYLSGPFRKIIFVSPSERDNAENKFRIWRGKGVVIINGVTDADGVSVAKWRSEVRNEFAIDTKTLVVGTVSRFDPAKNMLEAVSVAQRQKEMVFVWVGDGEGRVEVEKAISERGLTNIRILGARGDVLRILSACDMYLSTSLREGMPIAVLEAMSVGLPIVASRVVGNVDVVRDNVNGFLYTLGNPDEAASYLSQLGSEELRKKMGDESLALQRGQYSATVMAEAIYSEYLKIAQTEGMQPCV